MRRSLLIRAPLDLHLESRIVELDTRAFPAVQWLVPRQSQQVSSSEVFEALRHVSTKYNQFWIS
jgi:hypothetical protein